MHRVDPYAGSSVAAFFSACHDYQPLSLVEVVEDEWNLSTRVVVV